MPAPDVRWITYTIFREDLDMRVVDDYDRTKKSIEVQIPLRSKEADSPDMKRAFAANEWFKRMIPLRRNRKLFEDYVAAVRAAVEDDLRADVTFIQSTGGKITDAWIRDMTRSLVDRYYLDEDYAARIFANLDSLDIADNTVMPQTD